jgi:two-component system, cell cycle response regulator
MPAAAAVTPYFGVLERAPHGADTQWVKQSPCPRALERLAARLDDLEYRRSVDVPQRLAAARELEREADEAGATELAMRARLVRADMLQRGGRLVMGAELAQEVLVWARAADARDVLARSHLVLSSAWEGLGDAPACLEHAVMALELLDDSAPARRRGNFLLRLADALAIDGQLEAARERYRAAQAVFASIGDLERELNVLNNLAYSECEAGDPRHAYDSAMEARGLAERAGIPANPEFVDTLARALLGVGQLTEAAAVAERALTTLERTGDVQAGTPAELLLTLAETERRLGRLDDAQATLDRCAATCRDRNLVGLGVRTLAEQAELHAAAGRFELAYETHRRFHAESMRQASERRDAAARTRQALFETAEARRDAERYWRQARTDPLSGLPNRRFLDEELPRRLGSLDPGERLVVAIIDADHFKRINDTLSHEAGDHAISTLAAVLRQVLEDQAAASGGSASLLGRLGGEEFLAVIPPEDPDAEATLERLRAAVEAHDWTPVTGILRPTVSIGATRAGADEAPGDILRRADAYLYEAKRAGRNRVVADLAPVAAAALARFPLTAAIAGRRAAS